ncbi:MAG: cytochrome C biogenesis protein [Bacteroidetes bacterium]|nr:MAG: cytochrome C biogenesis protein [Bacteroidota bacterium]
MSINYIGEHLLPGQIGQILLWISFLSALVATFFYFRLFSSAKERPARLLNRSRTFYWIHVVSLTGVGVVLYYLIFNHYFEYSYVWQYSSRHLDVKYIISCFWAGQEGSFLVWALLQALVGLVLIRTSRNWEPGVMTFFALSQVFVTSMMLGVSIGGWEVGTSPFRLLRETVDTIQGTIFTEANYLVSLTDGNGLNPLLENIWMTIHPPILFLGYALSLVPFSYAMAALVRKEYTAWIRIVTPWTLLALLMLGAGILLGGAWAYVSLTFGGFWAWDPVENSSLIPWMTLVAALHFMLISRRQNYALTAAFVFTTLSYVLVLYASYLTRSGVLSETSAHSFGDNGMAAQLVIFLLIFLALSVWMIIRRAGQIQLKRKEILLSREFWMFIGSLVIVLAAFQILFTTSIPVVNALFGTRFAPPTDAVAFYNRWQTPYALLIAGFIAFSQFLRYDRNNTGTFLRKTIIPLVLSMGLTILFVVQGIVKAGNYILFLFFIWFAITSTLVNLLYPSSKPRNLPAIITHIGFTLFLLGVLITFSNSKIISSNTSGLDLGNARSNRENLLLMRNDTLYLGGFYVTYVDAVKEGNTTVYQVDFLKRNKGVYTRQFTLYPSVNSHPRMGDVYNPDTRNFLLKDYYMYIAKVGKPSDYIVIKAILNPYMNIIWLGSVVMLLGVVWALIKRVGSSQLAKNSCCRQSARDCKLPTAN